MDIIIRNIPDKIIASIDVAAMEQRLSRNEFLLRLLERHFGEPPILAGWLRLDRPGDLALATGDPDRDDDVYACPECGEPIDWPWFAVRINGELVGPVCSRCATSE